MEQTPRVKREADPEYTIVLQSHVGLIPKEKALGEKLRDTLTDLSPKAEGRRHLGCRDLVPQPLVHTVDGEDPLAPKPQAFPCSLLGLGSPCLREQWPEAPSSAGQSSSQLG